MFILYLSLWLFKEVFFLSLLLPFQPFPTQMEAPVGGPTADGVDSVC